MMKTAWKWALVVGLAVATAVSTLVWMRQFEAAQTSAAFVKLRGDQALERDRTVITEKMLEVVELPETFAGPLADFAVPGRPETYRKALIGQRAVQDVPAGSLLLFQYFAPDQAGDLAARLTPGARAITLPVTAQTTVGYFVRPGSTVDLIGTFLGPAREVGASEAEPSLITRTIQENVKVLAVGNARSGTEYQRLSSAGGYTTITVEVSPADANRLVAALRRVTAPITLALRRPDDHGINGELPVEGPKGR
jgi:Flp pilus assembly protein CpaB